MFVFCLFFHGRIFLLFHQRLQCKYFGVRFRCNLRRTAPVPCSTVALRSSIRISQLLAALQIGGRFSLIRNVRRQNIDDGQIIRKIRPNHADTTVRSNLPQADESKLGGGIACDASITHTTHGPSIVPGMQGKTISSCYRVFSNARFFHLILTSSRLLCRVAILL